MKGVPTRPCPTCQRRLIGRFRTDGDGNLVESWERCRCALPEPKVIHPAAPVTAAETKEEPVPQGTPTVAGELRQQIHTFVRDRLGEDSSVAASALREEIHEKYGVAIKEQTFYVSFFTPAKQDLRIPRGPQPRQKRKKKAASGPKPNGKANGHADPATFTTSGVSALGVTAVAVGNGVYAEALAKAEAEYKQLSERAAKLLEVIDGLRGLVA